MPCGDPWCGPLDEGCKVTRDYAQDPLQVLSLGGGTQSTAMILLVQEGRLPRPDWVIFADTGSELPFTLDIISRCQEICESLDIEFRTVRSPKGDLHQAYLNQGGLPVIGIRTCTTEWKIRPIYREIRSLVGMGRGKVLASSWIGITTDEDHRATPSEHKWIERKYPLLDLGWSRDDCVQYCESQDFQVQKSGCFCCPYQPVHQWEDLQKNNNEFFQIALEMERAARARGFSGGLLRSRESIERFNHTHTLEDFGLEITGSPVTKCDPGGGCFL